MRTQVRSSNGANRQNKYLSILFEATIEDIWGAFQRVVEHFILFDNSGLRHIRFRERRRSKGSLQAVS